MDIQSILPVLQMVLAAGNICIMGYAFKTFLNKPHDTLEMKHKELADKVGEHEVKIKEIETSLLQGNDRFREQNDTNEVLIRSVFALLEFEVHYCETEQKPISKNLEKAKDDLHDYLSRK